MANIVESFKLLFDRPSEPMVSPKGDQGAVFQLTDQLLGNEYKQDGIEINNRFAKSATQIIPLKELPTLPNLTKAMKLPRDHELSLFLPAHQEMADEVINVLLAVPENQLQELLSTCVYARVNLNPQLFNYCYTVALMHRKDTQNVPIQNFAETFPAMFINSQVFTKARENAAVSARGAPRVPIEIPKDFTASDLDTEHRVAYWREDIGVSLHHWHWHVIYPSSGPRSIVAKDRRGELFYYMHQQIVARYNGERLANSLARVQKFGDFYDPIPEAYFPKLDSLTTSRGWPPRQAHMQWPEELNRPEADLEISLNDMYRWRRNIEEAISTGMVELPNKSKQKLDIDTLGNMIEASILSPNIQFYGSLHNNGHNFAGFMHDPDNRYLESFSVMAKEATTMRDPFFYRWHEFIDDLFQRYKESSKVPPYTTSDLENPGVNVTSVQVESATGETNTLTTFWMQSDVDLSKGLDFSDRGPVYVRFTHLNHRRFKYVIEVNNTGKKRQTTVRIFMAPKFDERNQPWIFSDQRKMFIEMDRFVVPLNPGPNTITRSSTDSSVTIPFEQTFRDLTPPGDDPNSPDVVGFNYCGCGWPQHMLVPRGKQSGMPYQLFVMLSDYEFDSVKNPDGSRMSCKEASSYCGLKDRLYPDRRSMGFPFDRPSTGVDNIQKLILPNMALVDVTIRLQNVTEQNPKNPSTN